MDTTRFKAFGELCSQRLPDEIDKILSAAKGEKVCAIGFITTDDFYGFYLTWNNVNSINEYYEWQNAAYPDFLYQPLVDIVDGCTDIDLLAPSGEKWEFALALLSVLEKSIKGISEEIFQKNGFRREDVLFFSTMGDGDYIGEMLDASVKMFNAPERLGAFGISR